MPYVDDATAAGAVNNLGQAYAADMDPIKHTLTEEWKFPGATAVGYTKSAAIADATAIAVALLNALIQGKISDLKKDLADSYYSMAKYKWDRFERNYMPLEKKLLQEVSSEPISELDCDDDRLRAEQAVNTAYRASQTYMTRLRKSLHVCVDNNILSMIELARSKMLVDTENYNLIDDQYWCDIMNDDRWNKRSNVLDLGRNISSMAMSYGDTAKQSLNTVGPQIDLAANTLLTSIGYFGARNDTYYPTTTIGATPTTGSVGVNGMTSFPGAINNNLAPYTYGEWMV